jgi:hypothetical protein
MAFVGKKLTVYKIGFFVIFRRISVAARHALPLQKNV